MKKLTKKQIKQINESVSKENRSIKQRNTAFKELSPAEKRVQIARDVLAQLKSKRLIAQDGVWLTGVNGSSLFNEKDINNNPEFKSILKKQDVCEGCALGGMFMCAVERYNKLKIGDLVDVKGYKSNKKYYYLDGDANEDDTTSYLKRFFSEEQLNEIESAFEMGEGAKSGSDEARHFAEEVEDAEDRMRLIMENIIANNGKFRPEKKPYQIWSTPNFVG